MCCLVQVVTLVTTCVACSNLVYTCPWYIFCTLLHQTIRSDEVQIRRSRMVDHTLFPWSISYKIQQHFWAWAQIAIYTLQIKAPIRPISQLFSLKLILCKFSLLLYNDVLNNILAYGSFLFVELPIKLLIDFSSSKRISILIII